MTRKAKSSLIIEILLWIGTLIVFIPIAFLFINSLKAQSEVAGSLTMNLPATPMFENYSKVLADGKMPFAFINSFTYSVFSVALTCIFAAVSAYVMERRKSKLNKTFFALFMLGMIAPINMVTTYYVMKSLHFVNSYIGLILLYTASFLPFSIFLYQGFINNLSRSMDEAAIIDGAGPFRLFFRIIFPLLKPVTVTVAVLNFVNCWNDFQFPLYFTSDSKKWGVVLMLYQYLGQFFSSKQLLFSAAAIIVLPTIIVYLFGQRYIISGMTAGAVKG